MKIKKINAGMKSNPTIILLTALLVLAVGGFVYTLITTSIAGGYDREYIRHAGELRVLSQEIAKNSAEAAAGRATAFDALQQSTNEFSRRWGYLRNGDPTQELPPSPPQVSAELGAVQAIWDNVQIDARQIIDSRESVLTLHQLANSLRQAIPQLQREYDEAIAILLANNVAANELVIAQRQSWLAERMISNVAKILEGNDDAVLAADAFELDAAEFNRVYEGMLNGDSSLNISRVRNTQVLALFESIADQFQIVRDSADRIIEASPELFQVRDAANTISADSSNLLRQTSALTEHYQNLSGERLIEPYHAYMLGAAALLITLFLGITVYRGTRKNLSEQEQTNERNQGAIMRLLDEIADLADGDLTTSATVTEDFTGAIADSINFAIEQLRSLVISINENSMLVSRAAQETQATASQLSEASLNQAKEISEATGSINQIAGSMNNVSENASESSKVAEKSVVIANKGSAAVQNTINGMDKIREQIQKTSKQIKRLGESSQEIGDIVSLINDIADQTNILSLNAAIQASMAGEAGRGFAVVADEVQRLAERSSAATKQIEVLVKTIQADTNEAVISMEHTTAEVVQGARLAQDAGVALEEIEKVSNDLASLIQEISTAARAQSEAANRISSTMNVIQEITTQTSSGTMATATSIGNLAEMAKEMRDTVSGFKLPSEVAAEPAMNEDFVAEQEHTTEDFTGDFTGDFEAEGNIELPEFSHEALADDVEDIDLDLEIEALDEETDDLEHGDSGKRNISAA